MVSFLDNFLNNITMYRLVFYVLTGLLLVAEIFSFLHLLPFTPLALFLSICFLTAICWITNTLLAKLFHVQTNIESVYISACILALISSPQSVVFLFIAAVITIVSKYIITINKKHIFNPVAFGVWAGALLTGHYASWWVGTAVMLPFVLIGGFLIVRKIRRGDMIVTFLVVATLTIFFFDISQTSSLLQALKKIFLDTPIIFFSTVMLTEPLTTPPTTPLQMIYAGIVGILFPPQIHFLRLYSTPELALLIGNIFSFIVSPKVRLQLSLMKKIQQTQDIYDFVFSPSQKFSFVPGQYMEWTLSHKNPDSRGNRRYFTIASSPTEKEVIVGIRFNPQGSSFKNTLSSLRENNDIIASQIAGDFTMPKDIKKKLVFIAGGIGVTPFRSMVKCLLDTKEKRDIVIIYSAKNPDDFPYKDIFDDAARELGMKVVYTITSRDVPSHWKGHKGRVTEALIQEEIPDFAERIFYISGPNAMVESYEKLLKKIGVKAIKKDYFPGFA